MRVLESNKSGSINSVIEKTLSKAAAFLVIGVKVMLISSIMLMYTLKKNRQLNPLNNIAVGSNCH